MEPDELSDHSGADCGAPADEFSSCSEEDNEEDLNPFLASINPDEVEPEAPPGFKWEKVSPTDEGKYRFRLRREHELVTREPWYEGIDEEYIDSWREILDSSDDESCYKDHPTVGTDALNCVRTEVPGGGMPSIRHAPLGTPIASLMREVRDMSSAWLFTVPEAVTIRPLHALIPRTGCVLQAMRQEYSRSINGEDSEFVEPGVESVRGEKPPPRKSRKASPAAPHHGDWVSTDEDEPARGSGPANPRAHRWWSDDLEEELLPTPAHSGKVSL